MKYVSAVKGAIVGRLGSGTATTKPSQIGVRFDPSPDPVDAPDLGEWVTDEEEIVAIPDSEWAQHARHYEKALERGHLKARTEKDFSDWSEKQAKAGQAEAERLTKEREAELARGKELAEKEAAKAKAEEDARRDSLRKAREAILERRRGGAPKPPEPESPRGDSPPATESETSKTKKKDR